MAPSRERLSRALQETQRNPSPPFTTSTLQQTANGRLGLGAAATMSAAQSLYEGGKGLGEDSGFLCM